MEAGATLLPRRPPLALEPYDHLLPFSDRTLTSLTLSLFFIIFCARSSFNLIISPELLDAKGTLLHKAIILRHMDDIAIRKASEEQLLA
ncbi:unnamed protein product [Musa hybrid cultivar]